MLKERSRVYFRMISVLANIECLISSPHLMRAEIINQSLTNLSLKHLIFIAGNSNRVV